MRAGVMKTYSRATLTSKTYQIATIEGATESAECKFIQQKKDELLISLTQYFAKEIEKTSLEGKLSTIRRELVDMCPAYVSKVGCC